MSAIIIIQENSSVIAKVIFRCGNFILLIRYILEPSLLHIRLFDEVFSLQLPTALKWPNKWCGRIMKNTLNEENNSCSYNPLVYFSSKTIIFILKYCLTLCYSFLYDTRQSYAIISSIFKILNVYNKNKKSTLFIVSAKDNF